MGLPPPPGSPAGGQGTAWTLLGWSQEQVALMPPWLWLLRTEWVGKAVMLTSSGGTPRWEQGPVAAPPLPAAATKREGKCWASVSTGHSSSASSQGSGVEQMTEECLQNDTPTPPPHRWPGPCFGNITCLFYFKKQNPHHLSPSQRAPDGVPGQPGSRQADAGRSCHHGPPGCRLCSSPAPSARLLLFIPGSCGHCRAGGGRGRAVGMQGSLATWGAALPQPQA